MCLNTKLNVQKSYWKLKENVISTGNLMNAKKEIKLIKLFSIIKRHADINKWKSFYHILNYGKTDYHHLDASYMVHDKMNRSGIS